MKKQKLIDKRSERGFSQNEIAHFLSMEQSTYSRRESGDTKISKNEWKKLAEILDCSVDEIYEPDTTSNVHIDTRNSVFHDNSGNYNQYYNIPVSVLHNLQDYIQHLKDYIEDLKTEIENLKK